MTLSIAKILTWAFWRRHRAIALSMLMPLAAVVVFSFEAARRGDAAQPSSLQTFAAAFHFPFLLVALCHICSLVSHTPQSAKQMYALPLATWEIVGWPMLNGALAAGLIYIIAGALVNGLYRAGWPLAGPALICATGFCWSQTIVWGARNSRPLRLIFLGLTALVAIVVIRWRSLAQMAGEPPAPIDLSVWGTAGCLTAILAAFGAAVLAVRWDRRGDGLSVPSIGRFFAIAARRLPAAAQTFRSATFAQCWMEWRERGIAMPVVFLGAAAVLFLWMASGLLDHRQAGQLVMGFSFFLVMGAFGLGIFMGHSGRGDLLGSFKAALPLTDAQLAQAILKSTAAAAVLSWLSWVAISLLGLIVFFGNQLPNMEIFAGGWKLVCGGIFAGGVLTWTAASLGAAVAMCRRRTAEIVYWTFMAVMAVLILSVMFLIPREYRTLVWEILAAVTGVLLSAATITVFWLAVRFRHLTAPAALISGAVAVGLMLLVFSQAPLASLGWPYWIQTVGLAWMPVLPLAAAPLAMSWNRHR